MLPGSNVKSSASLAATRVASFAGSVGELSTGVTARVAVGFAGAETFASFLGDVVAPCRMMFSLEMCQFHQLIPTSSNAAEARTQAEASAKRRTFFARGRAKNS